MKKLIAGFMIALMALLMFTTPVLAQTTLVGDWDFEDCSGTTVTDSSGYGNDGTMYNFTDGWVTGKIGSCALEFNKTASQVVNLGNDSSLNFGEGDFSIEAWIKPKASTLGMAIYNKENADSSIATWFGLFGILLSYSNNMSIDVWNDTDYDGAGLTPFNLTDGDWHHVVAVRNSSNIMTFADGVLQSIGTAYGTNADSTANATLGFEREYYWFNGTMDGVRVYTGALSGDEVENLYLYDQLTVPTTTTLGPIEETLTDIGTGVGGLLDQMGSPITVFMILMGLVSGIAIVFKGVFVKFGG